MVSFTTNIPGPDKQLPGVEAVLRRGWALLSDDYQLRLMNRGVDILGPWLIAAADPEVEPRELKRAAMGIEAGEPWARLLDLDVYVTATAAPLDRRALGSPPRRCLLCGAPAQGCVRGGRHDPRARQRRVNALLAEARGEQRRGQLLADALVAGARAELELTPKPGLVDLESVGSHPDLDAATMLRSVALLPRYFDALLEARASGAELPALAAIGLEAEARMWRTAGSNTHAGQIFLGGLLLAALPDPDAKLAAGAPATSAWREEMSALATRHFAAEPVLGSHGSGARERYGVSGIVGEARAGLPLIFEGALPCYRAARARGEDPRRASYRVMALVMQTLEDTTALHRCGERGLAQLRADGAKLAALLDGLTWPAKVDRWLRARDAHYRADNLTMGGVADTLALTLALGRFFDILDDAI